jgi:flagellum-specific ATP synthase
MNDPVADAMRSLLDGHIVLSRELAWRNHYPCIDVLASVSRLMPDLVPMPYTEKAGKVRELISTYLKAEDMINIGAYAKGSNPRIDLALKKIDVINTFLRQRCDERVSAEHAMSRLIEITQDC